MLGDDKVPTHMPGDGLPTYSDNTHSKRDNTFLGILREGC